MRVFVWTGGHTIAESLIQDPPPGITIESNIDTPGQGSPREAGERRFSIDPEHKRLLDRVVYAFGVPRFLPTLSDADLIHTISGLIPTVPRPWVTTISMPSSFFGLHDEWNKSRRHVWTMMKVLRSSNCKAVMSFSDATHKGFMQLLGDRLGPEDKQKLSVVYPAVNSDKFRKKGRREDDKFRILFVGNHFFDKGGRELFGAVSRIAGRYDVHLDLVTDAPPHHKAALEAFMKSHQEEWVSWHVPKVSRKRLIEEFFPRADVFVMCSYIDVFGFVLIEAMASGLPVIAANVYAQSEIVEEGRNGYLINVPITPFEGNPALRTLDGELRYRQAIVSEGLFANVSADIEDRLRRLIEDGRLRQTMSNRSIEMTTEGKFSIGWRNKVLKEIYQSAVD